MTRDTFLQQLKDALQGEMNAADIQKNLDYYASYIYEEMRLGKSEEEVLSELGSPWAIAKTLLVTGEDSGSQYYDYAKEVASSTGETRPEGIGDDAKKIIAIVVFIAIVVILLSILFGVLAFAIRYAVPILIIVLVIRLLRKK